MTVAIETAFAVPEGTPASEPPEARGHARDEVRLMVATPDGIAHRCFRDLPQHLHAGDLIVINTSATLPAAVDGMRNGAPATVHFSSKVAGAMWVVELRTEDGDGQAQDVSGDDVIVLPGPSPLHLVGAYPHARTDPGSRMWRAVLETECSVESYLARHGRPISYDYVNGSWPLADYQTIFARHPGSVEMPSAARPLSHALVTDLVAQGVNVAPIVLHAGVSSLEAGETPMPERFEVPRSTAWLVNATHAAGGRVIAVGTTVARALESVALPDGTVTPGKGTTDLVLGPGRPARTITGLVTGWHPPKASHLFLLQAVAGQELVQTAYKAAVAEGYLWHEFGDSCLLLPPLRGTTSRSPIDPLATASSSGNSGSG